MPTFTAKEREVGPVGVDPGEKVPVAPEGYLDYFGTARMHYYEHEKHTLAEMLADGYFGSRKNPESAIPTRGSQFVGGLILYTLRLGSQDPDDWAAGLLRVTVVPGVASGPAGEKVRVKLMAMFSEGKVRTLGKKSKAA